MNMVDKKKRNSLHYVTHLMTIVWVNIHHQCTLTCSIEYFLREMLLWYSVEQSGAYGTTHFESFFFQSVISFWPSQCNLIFCIMVNIVHFLKDKLCTVLSLYWLHIMWRDYTIWEEKHEILPSTCHIQLCCTHAIMTHEFRWFAFK